MYISGVKFEDHCSNISRDVLDWVLNCVSRTTYDIITHKAKTSIISGCDGPTERISSFLDHILQPIAQAQKSYLKDTTQFINFIEKRIVPKNAILVSMDVNSLYTNIPQE